MMGMRFDSPPSSAIGCLCVEETTFDFPIVPEGNLRIGCAVVSANHREEHSAKEACAGLSVRCRLQAQRPTCQWHDGYQGLPVEPV